MYFPADKKERNWNGYTFLLPCVSVGNVGQLTTDLVISTLSMERVGFIHHESILPLIGNDPFAKSDMNVCQMTTSCEVYEDRQHKLVVLQQRAPFVQGKKKLFASWLAEWARQQHFGQVVILTTCFAEERLDIQLQGSQFRYVASESMTRKSGEMFSDRLGWRELERRPGLPELSTSPNSSLYMPGSGIAKQLFENLQADTAVVVLLKFCSEGDNAPDAVAMVTQLNNWIGLVKPKEGSDAGPLQWKVPISWRLVFGNRVDPSLFH